VVKGKAGDGSARPEQEGKMSYNKIAMTKVTVREEYKVGRVVTMKIVGGGGEDVHGRGGRIRTGDHLNPM
jgi:hypothetical protein